MQTSYETHQAPGGGLIKSWTRGVPFDENSLRQLQNAADLPFIQPWVAAMPDVHLGLGATVGSVIPTSGAVIPAAVGVDIGCGMMAVKTGLGAADLPENLRAIRAAIEAAVPHGRTAGGGRNDRGAWSAIPDPVAGVWRDELATEYAVISAKHPAVGKANSVNHLGTLGTGNHFIEMCLDEDQSVWFMLHSGSRGVGNKIGTYFIELAKRDMRTHAVNLPDVNLAYLSEGTQHFQDYVQAVEWAQKFAMLNRRLMMERLLAAVAGCRGVPPFAAQLEAVNCHHNYVTRERHFGQDLLITRKGAVRAAEGDRGIIPGSMGARSFIVRGKGNPHSFNSCSHGAGRVLSRTAAKKKFTLEDHARATAGVECRKDKDVLDETPGAYKDIDAVMRAQHDLVDIEYTLKQIVCVKG